MNQKNLEYLQEQVKYTGFGEGLSDEIRTKIEGGEEKFTVWHEAEFGKDKVDAVLFFSKSKESDMYFFNKYDMALAKEGETEKLAQTFYINKGNNITLKEAYNLMEGRAVNKNLTSAGGELYNTWLQLDFKQADDRGNFKLRHFNEKFGYDLEAALAKHPIKELSDESHKKELMASLKKGNLQSVTLVKDGAEKKHYIEATPQYKSITIYDENRQRLDSRKAKSEKQAEDSGQSAKNESKKQAVADDESGLAAKKTRSSKKKGQGV
ncbi:hypothetical protein [Sphingobacterium siyangense]|uniref:hypothetical protein n=1 Tax=Sphingobacterium siyangense TaxID=459529 RepID=UPI00196279C6|nr:hypothetical protein [Sphingobacterium siyangense]QRY55587.1 hypothetical protein JVX97_16245 [Sphingobacterium siyangense]